LDPYLTASVESVNPIAANANITSATTSKVIIAGTA
jgi:hypothetical protein